MDREELKPCPFCGCSAVLGEGDFGEIFPMCDRGQCGASFGAGIWAQGGSVSSIVKKWNTRVGEANEES